jgi:hopanoid biosynthesis associated RND transporter like protein HpnN
MWLTRAVVRAPVLVLALAAVMTVASLAVTGTQLKFHTSRLDLLDPALAYNQRWLAYLDEFGSCDDVVVVVEGPNGDAVGHALADVAHRLRAEQHLFSNILYQPDLSVLRGKALHYLPVAQLRLLDEFLGHLSPVVQGDWAQLDLLRQLEWSQRLAATPSVRRAGWEASGGESSEVRDADLQEVPVTVGSQQRLANRQIFVPTTTPWGSSLLAALTDPDRCPTPWSRWQLGLEQLSQRFPTGLMIANGGRQGFLLLRIATDETDFVRGRNAVARLRELIRQTAVMHPEVSIGTTGVPILETDEMATSQSDSTRSTLWGLVGVVLILFVGFRGWRGPLFMMVTLLVALAWTLGFATVAVGHLNILSMSFGAMLIGLGIDFGIHFYARYVHVRTQIADDETALPEAARGIGPGLVSGGLTTAVAFFAATLTDFKGVAELGIIAGGGMLLCLVAALTVLPAILRLSAGPSAATCPAVARYLAAACAPFWRHPMVTLVGSLSVTAVAAVGVPRLQYDHNLLNLQSVGLESVELEHRLASDNDRSMWYAIAMADTQRELSRLKARFESLDVVARTEEIASLLPEPDPARTALVSAIHQRLAVLPAHPPLIPVVPREVLLQALLSLSPGGERGREWDSLLTMSDRTYFQRVSHLQQTTATDLLALLHSIRALSNPVPPQHADVPRELLDRYVGRHGRHLLKVYGRGSIWDMAALEHFVRSVERVDPRITGHPIQTYYASREMQSSYLHAGIYAVFAVLIVVILDFRSVRYTLLSLVPLALGTVLLFGMLGWLGITLNAANLIVLPLILGTGVDNGVHLIHDFREQRGGYRVSPSTASAILFCSTTTMVGFASLMLSQHRGLQSLGLVLTLGMASCLLVSLLSLPALLSLLRPASQPPSRMVF